MDTPTRVARALVPTALAALLAAGCASGPPRAEDYVAPQPGVVAEYVSTSSGSFGNGVAKLPVRVEALTFEGRPAQSFANPGLSTVLTPQAGLIAVLDATGRVVMRYDPPLGMRWPLELGKTWTGRHVLTLGSGAKAPMTTTWAVEAYEKVTVPAGTFDAWRVTMTDSFGFRQTTWSVPSRMGMYAKRVSERPAGHPQGAGVQTLELSRVPARP